LVSSWDREREKTKTYYCSLWVGFSTHERRPLPAQPAPRRDIFIVWQNWTLPERILNRSSKSYFCVLSYWIILAKSGTFFILLLMRIFGII
jgi:hypothetical protein